MILVSNQSNQTTKTMYHITYFARSTKKNTAYNMPHCLSFISPGIVDYHDF